MSDTKILDTEIFDMFDDALRKEHRRNFKEATKLLGTVVDVTISSQIYGDIYNATTSCWDKTLYIGHKPIEGECISGRVILIAKTHTVKPIVCVTNNTSSKFKKRELIELLRPIKSALGGLIFDSNMVDEV